jgi:hypothetical protein
MIITRLAGGLGNQLFQYAAARGLAVQRDIPLKLDTKSGFRSDPYQRSYALHNYPIAAASATRFDLARFPLKGIRRRIFRFLTRNKPYHARSVCREPANQLHIFDPNLRQAPRHVYLIGYWQTAKYFEHIASEIRRELTPLPPLSPQTQHIAAQIAQTQAVSIHFRYLHGISADKTRQIQPGIQAHGTCSPDYYQAAIRLIASHIAHPHFFVFSDNPAQAIQNPVLSNQETTFIQGSQDWEELWLMSRCQHHIIANSTFSWWGAWLNPASAKMVIAPRQWYNGPIGETTDLLPADWIRL